MKLNQIQKDWVVTECRFAGVDEQFARQLLEKLLAPYNTKHTREYSVKDYISVIKQTWLAEHNTTGKAEHG